MPTVVEPSFCQVEIIENLVDNRSFFERLVKSTHKAYKEGHPLITSIRRPGRMWYSDAILLFEEDEVLPKFLCDVPQNEVESLKQDYRVKVNGQDLIYKGVFALEQIKPRTFRMSLDFYQKSQLS